MIRVALKCPDGHEQAFYLPRPFTEQSADQFATLLVEGSRHGPERGCFGCRLAGVQGLPLTASIATVPDEPL